MQLLQLKHTKKWPDKNNFEKASIDENIQMRQKSALVQFYRN